MYISKEHKVVKCKNDPDWFNNDLRNALPINCVVCECNSECMRQIREMQASAISCQYFTDIYLTLTDKLPKPSYVKMHQHIVKVIFNDPATVVFWSDGSKTVVKCHDIEIFDKEKGLAMAIAKKALGDTNDYRYIFRKYTCEIDGDLKPLSSEEQKRRKCYFCDSAPVKYLASVDGEDAYICNTCALLRK